MTDWQAAVRTWEAREEAQKGRTEGVHANSGVSDELISDEYAQMVREYFKKMKRGEEAADGGE